MYSKDTVSLGDMDLCVFIYLKDTFSYGETHNILSMSHVITKSDFYQNGLRMCGVWPGHAQSTFQVLKSETCLDTLANRISCEI